MYDVWVNSFSQNQFKRKYSMNGKENWKQTCNRVAEAIGHAPIKKYMYDRKFIPAGRYLYAAGRPFHQVNNCFLFRATDSREGWAEALHKATMALMTGGGIGIDYSDVREKGAIISKTGGHATGPLSLMSMVNEAGRYIMQGGQRRSAIWAGLHWIHPDVKEFLHFKDWPEEWRTLKEQDFNFPLPMELTNISVIYDTPFFKLIEGEMAWVLGDEKEWAEAVWLENCRQAFKTAEPGMSFNYFRDRESLRNAPVSASTRVLTRGGYRTVGDIIGQEITVWTGQQWAKTVFKKTKENAQLVKVHLSNGRSIVCDPEHPFIAKDYNGAGQRKKVVTSRIPAGKLSIGQKIVSDLPTGTVFERPYIHNLRAYGMGFVVGDGSISNKRGEVSYHSEDKSQAFSAAKKGLGAETKSKGNRAYFRCDFNNKREVLDEYHLHPDFIAGWFDADGCYTRNLLRLSCSKLEYLKKCQEALDFMGIQSVVREDGASSYKPENPSFTLNVLAGSLVRFKNVIPTTRIKIDLDDTWKPYRKSELRVVAVQELNRREDVYCCDVGVEEHSFMAEGVIISNCCEVTSADDSDKCNLGTLWINRFDDKDDFVKGIRQAVRFLMRGALYSHLPTHKIQDVGEMNNRIGLGLGGLHEWLMLRGEGYEVTPELHDWLRLYKEVSDEEAYKFSKKLGVSEPKGKRAIAPTGTIGILAETTTGIEPIFCKSYKRRTYAEGGWHTEYVVDGTVKRLMEAGVPVENIQDAHDLTFEQRVKFQADVQDYVDMAISSTCNMPEWGSEGNNESNVKEKADILLKYAKRLRGFTCYPDGARAGQPLTRCDLEEALSKEGVVYEEHEDECKNGVCGI